MMLKNLVNNVVATRPQRAPKQTPPRSDTTQIHDARVGCVLSAGLDALWCSWRCFSARSARRNVLACAVLLFVGVYAAACRVVGCQPPAVLLFFFFKQKTAYEIHR